jgi:hypothetical protein
MYVLSDPGFAAGPLFKLGSTATVEAEFVIMEKYSSSRRKLRKLDFHSGYLWL